MKTLLKYLICALFLTVSLNGGAEEKIYTKKVKLENFPNQTTKVVLSGNSLLEITLRDEVSSRWHVSPFEFCTIEEYESLKDKRGYYFLHLVAVDGIAFLTLDKSGKADDPSTKDRPFEIVRIPVAAAGDYSGREFDFMGAFVDILQTFVEDAMMTDKAGYLGLKYYNMKDLAGVSIQLDEHKADDAFARGEQGVAVPLVIAPVNITFSTRCYKMIISADTHSLCFYSDVRYSGPGDKIISERDIKRIQSRNAVIAE